ncbi:MAG: TonB family protein [Terracidiphilus sp.]|jgi:peptidyl-prolyl cis-trans isomerase A (cyclophilin A)
MKIQRTLLFSALAACTALVVFAQQSTSPASQEIPDAPQATPEAMIVPNGPYVVMDTSMGRITCQFYQKQAPNAVANFIGLAEGTKDWTDPTTNKVQHHKRYYDGTTYHRVIPEFMIQGGDPTGTGMGGPGYAFDDEFDPNLNFDRPGRLALANSGPNTNGSQFFVTELPFESGNGHYVIFGQCDDASVDVVKAIARVQRDSNDKPLTPVVLEKVMIVNQLPPPVPPPPPPPPPSAAVTPMPGAAPPPRRISISAGVAVGLIISKVQPVYPIDAKKAGVSGRVVLSAVIGTDGIIKELQVVSGPDLLQQAALDAVNRWRYRPYLLNDEPVEVRTTINIIFTLAR